MSIILMLNAASHFAKVGGWAGGEDLGVWGFCVSNCASNLAEMGGPEGGWVGELDAWLLLLGCLVTRAWGARAGLGAVSDAQLLGQLVV